MRVFAIKMIAIILWLFSIFASYTHTLTHCRYSSPSFKWMAMNLLFALHFSIQWVVYIIHMYLSTRVSLIPLNIPPIFVSSAALWHEPVSIWAFVTLFLCYALFERSGGGEGAICRKDCGGCRKEWGGAWKCIVHVSDLSSETNTLKPHYYDSHQINYGCKQFIWLWFHYNDMEWDERRKICRQRERERLTP